jgi:hypothetical protein
MATSRDLLDNLNRVALKLPVINVSHSPRTVGKQMIEAAAKDGFFYIDTRDTSFTSVVVERQFDLVYSHRSHTSFTRAHRLQATVDARSCISLTDILLP